MQSVSGMTDFRKQVLEAAGCFLLDFWGPSCAPCVDLNRSLESLEAAYAGRVRFIKINADEELDIALHCGVRGLPTLILIKDGQLSERWLGMHSVKVLQAKLDKAIPGPHSYQR